MIAGYSLALTGGERWLAEDITQETFIRAIKGYCKFRGESKVSTWLCQIAKYTYYQYIEKRGKTNEISDEVLEELPTEIWPELEFIEKENTKEMIEKLNELSESVREVVLLRVYGEMSFYEIGRVLGQSENWARVNFFRAKAKLKNRLLEEMNDEKEMTVDETR